MARSKQEALVAKLSNLILGNYGLFQPTLYGRNANEPADLAWIANRCAILMYMTEGTKNYESKKRHNLRQFHRWLKKWKEGVVLSGKSDLIDHTVHYDDVDHIVVISVVGGPDSWCEFHSDCVSYYADDKVSACATITNELFWALANNCATPRELVSWLRHLSKPGLGRIAANEFLQIAKNEVERNISALVAQYRQFVSRPYQFKSLVDRTNATFLNLKSNPLAGIAEQDVRLSGAQINSEVISDLRIADLVWFGIVGTIGKSLMPEKGAYGPAVMCNQRQSGIYYLFHIVKAHIGADDKGFLDRALTKEPSLGIITSYDFGINSPVQVLMTGRRIGTSILENELTDLRQEVLSNHSPNIG